MSIYRVVVLVSPLLLRLSLPFVHQGRLDQNYLTMGSKLNAPEQPVQGFKVSTRRIKVWPGGATQKENGELININICSKTGAR